MKKEIRPKEPSIVGGFSKEDGWYFKFYGFKTREDAEYFLHEIHNAEINFPGEKSND